MPTTSATIVKTVDGQGGVGRKLRHPLTVRVQNPVMLRVTSNDFENPASCSVYVYFDIDSGVSADEAEALWLSAS
eukprot:tig00021290_g19986.t1